MPLFQRACRAKVPFCSPVARKDPRSVRPGSEVHARAREHGTSRAPSRWTGMNNPYLFRAGAQLIERRELLQLLALGSVVSASGLLGCASGAQPASSPGDGSPAAAPPGEDFLFLQLSDTHWGYSGANNPEADVTLPQAVQAINASPIAP